MDIEALMDQSANLLRTGKATQAIQVLKQVLKAFPQNAEAHHLTGLAHMHQQRAERAVASIEKAVSLDATRPVFWNNLGLIYAEQGKTEQALLAHTKAIELQPQDSLSRFHRANVYGLIGRIDDAVADYEAALVCDPYAIDVMNNFAGALVAKHEFTQAQRLYEDALRIDPNFAQAWNNQGLLQQRQHQTEQAQQSYERAIALVPDYVQAHVNLGNLLLDKNEYAQAAQQFNQVLRINPNQPFALGNLAYARAMLCDWQQYRQVWTRIHDQVRRGGLPCSPIVFLNGSDDAALAKKLTQTYSRLIVPDIAVPAFTSGSRSGHKLRIGYFSSDYREHPLTTLITGVFEHHDRNRFEVIGYALNQAQASTAHERVRAAFDEFHEIAQMNDSDVVDLVRAHQLDIAIDLNGYTEGSRPAIFKARVAPLQISYLGFPGTSGSDFVDYTIADHHVIPAQHRQFYTEKILYLPDSFQPNDDTRVVEDAGLERSQFGLAPDEIVFCCFNKLYKLNPQVFESWMRILKEVSGSVLWLYSEDEAARGHLRRYARKAGIDSDRLVFAGRTEKYEHHLARYRLADLFLDTFPYTAHTTASDALWAGLPVLTRTGESFASRVGESLLHSLGMPELSTQSAAQFEQKAVALAKEEGGFDRLKKTLELAKQSSALYQTGQYTRWLEAGYEKLARGDRADVVMVARED